MAIWDSLSNCLWFGRESQRNTISSMLAGILVRLESSEFFYIFYLVFYFQFFSGWWFLIDAMSLYPHSMNAIHVVLGILGTISLFMVNSVTQAQVNSL